MHFRQNNFNSATSAIAMFCCCVLTLGEKPVTGSEVAVDLLMQNKDKIRLFDISISMAGSSMVLSKSVVILFFSGLTKVGF